jgi:fructokinase
VACYSSKLLSMMTEKGLPVTAPHVVSIGEALVDMIETDTEKGAMYLPAWGGSSLNVAVGVARLGTPSHFAGSFADDPLAKRLTDFLTSNGVGLDTSVRNAPALTTIAMTTFVNHEPRYSFYANPASYGFLPAAIGHHDIIGKASVVHAGSLGILEDSTFDAIVNAFRHTSGLVTLDPNVRPAMVHDWDVFRARIGKLIVHTDILKVSIEDIEAMYPGSSAEAIALAAINQGVKAVVVTQAADGATVVTADGSTQLPIPSGGQVIDTTGAGDSMMAALIHQVSQNGAPGDHSGWVDSVKNALIIAAIVCSRRGGAIAMPTGEEARAAGATV